MSSISDDQLIEYLLGMADGSEQSAIEAEMVASEELRARLTTLRETLALPGLSVEPMSPSQNLWSRIQNSISTDNPFAGFVSRLTVFLDLSEQRVVELLQTVKDGREHWQRSDVPGILIHDFIGGPRHTNSECSIVCIESNATFPKHGHAGDEWGFVLQGEAREDNGHTSRPGDIVYKSSTDQHSITATSSEPFVFFTIHNGIVLIDS